MQGMILDDDSLIHSLEKIQSEALELSQESLKTEETFKEVSLYRIAVTF